MPGPPAETPIGLHLARTARTVTRAFDAALDAAGGSRPTWLVLLALTTGTTSSQRELAEVVGIRGATLTHHLAGMESAGLVTRRRDPANRRVHQVELTAAGREAFRRFQEVARDHDRRLHAGLSSDDVATLRRALARMSENVTGATGP